MNLTKLIGISAFIISTNSVAADLEPTSYGMGFKLGNNLRNEEVTLNVNSFTNGLKDGYTNTKSKVSEKDINDALDKFRQEQTTRVQEKIAKISSVNLTKGRKYMSENKVKEGVVTTDSGLQYKVLNAGDKTGISPGVDNNVKVHYKGELTNGTEFDSSYKRGEPISFPVNGVIKGWTEALQLMKPGDKWKLFIPSELAYGSRGAGSAIGPNEALVFEVELLEVN